MTNCRKTTVGFVALVLALAAGIFIGMQGRPEAPGMVAVSPENIARFLSTRLPDSNGNIHSFTDWREKILVINFWASWCAPCREEMPYFSRLQVKYAAKNVQFAGIALDNATNVGEFSKTLPVSYPLLIAETEGSELTRQLGNSRLGLPYTIVLGPRNEVRFTRLGRVTEQELDRLLQELTTGQ